MTTSTRMRHRATGKSALAVCMHIAAPVITASEQDHIRRPWHHHVAAVTSSAHGHNASRGEYQQRDPKPKRNSICHSVQLVHMELSFVEAIKHGKGFRNPVRRALTINRIILSA